MKEKRALISPLINWLRKQNLSVIESDHQDSWQQTGLAITKIALHRDLLERDLNQIFIEMESRFPQINILDKEIEFFV